MTNQKQRIVLNLSKEHAQELNKFIMAWATSADSEAQEKLMKKISKRLEKSINKPEVQNGL